MSRKRMKFSIYLSVCFQLVLRTKFSMWSAYFPRIHELRCRRMATKTSPIISTNHFENSSETVEVDYIHICLFGWFWCFGTIENVIQYKQTLCTLLPHNLPKYANTHFIWKYIRHAFGFLSGCVMLVVSTQKSRSFGSVLLNRMACI